MGPDKHFHTWYVKSQALPYIVTSYPVLPYVECDSETLPYEVFGKVSRPEYY